MIARVRAHRGPAPALLDAARGETRSYAELLDQVDALAALVAKAADGRALVFLAMAPDADAIALELACIEAGLPVCLCEPGGNALARLIEAYAPALVMLPDPHEPPSGYRDLGAVPHAAYRIWRRDGDTPAPPLHPDLALLLTTSGSTGSPKLVRLTRANLEANAASIAEYLAIEPGERALQSLPSHYSYGLSVVHSHLAAGASVVLTPHSFMRPEFWSAFDALECTSFAGVPYVYETLHRLRFAPERHPRLRTMTQAGGHLRPDLAAHFHGVARTAGARFFVMYGQTEATARIAYVPPERLPEKLGSIGVAIPGGRLRLAPVGGGEGLEELVYEGPNVMMGYAESPADLALGDVQQGVLRTGDLGRVDADGFHYVTGRLQRFAKLFGRRVSLEDVERELESSFPVRAMAFDGGDRIVAHVAMIERGALEPIAAHLARYLGVPPKAVDVRVEESLPVTASGKKDYRALAAGARGAAAPEASS